MFIKRFLLMCVLSTIPATFGFAQTFKQVPVEGLPKTVKPRSTFFKSTTEKPLGQLQTDAQISDVIKDADWRTALVSAGLTLNVVDDADHKYLLSLPPTTFRPPEKELPEFEKLGLPNEFDLAAFDLELELDQKWSSKAIEEGSIQQLRLKNLDLMMNGMSLNGNGLVNLDEDGLMQGQFKVSFKKWRDVLKLLNIENEAQRRLIEATVSAKANGDEVDVVFDIQDNQLIIGPIMLMKLPSLPSIIADL